MTTTNNADVIKAAAHRMCAVFKTKGMPVKHSLMLEALAQGFGVDSWRALKATVDAPKAIAAPVAPPLGVEQGWTVDAIYRDNSQGYCDTYSGRTPLEAGISAMVERLTDFGLEIGLLGVTNEDNSIQFYPNTADEIELHTNRAAIETVLNACLMLNPSHYLLQNGCSFLQDVLQDTAPAKDCPDILTDLTDYEDSFEAGKPVEPTPSVEPSVIEGLGITPTQLILKLCETVEQSFGSVMEMAEKNEDLAIAVYQLRAMTDFFGGNFNNPDKSVFLDYFFEEKSGATAPVA
jgi:hypothetical protein